MPLPKCAWTQIGLQCKLWFCVQVAKDSVKPTGGSSIVHGAAAALLALQSPSEQQVSDTRCVVALFVLVAHTLLHSTSFHSFCDSCSIAHTAVQQAYSNFFRDKFGCLAA